MLSKRIVDRGRDNILDEAEHVLRCELVVGVEESDE
jgi:hypothetical protein